VRIKNYRPKQWLKCAAVRSGAGTNLKVGGAPVRSEAPEKIFFGRAPPLFGSKSTNSRFGERFRDGQYSLVSFLFAVLLLTVPPPRAQPFVKGGTFSRAPWSRRQLRFGHLWLSDTIRVNSPSHADCMVRVARHRKRLAMRKSAAHTGWPPKVSHQNAIGYSSLPTKFRHNYVKCQSKTVKLSLGIKYFMCDLNCDVKLLCVRCVV